MWLKVAMAWYGVSAAILASGPGRSGVGGAVRPFLNITGRPPDGRCIVFYHIQKTGGGTITSLLKRWLYKLAAFRAAIPCHSHNLPKLRR